MKASKVMEETEKGTVTSLASLFPADEARKAMMHVQDKIAESQKQLDQLRAFADDNTNLINLVQKLPEDLHHDIMVPFGKAAFFPGRLIHTNEFMVLLGEGYYADRTSKQTIEILKRRGKALDSQVGSVKAVIKDLKTEVSFFDATAAEAEEGVVEIKEEYIEDTAQVPETGPPKQTLSDSSKADHLEPVDEDEYSRMMSRLDELEKEELAAQSIDESSQDEEYPHRMSSSNETEKNERASNRVRKDTENEPTEVEDIRQSLEHIQGKMEAHQLSNPAKDKHAIIKELPGESTFKQDLCNQASAMALSSLIEGSRMKSVPEAMPSVDQNFASNNSSTNKKASALPEVKGASNNSSTNKKAPSLPIVKETIEAQPEPQYMAFTGSIIERTHNLEPNPSKSNASQTSKPVSRFKLQRR